MNTTNSSELLTSAGLLLLRLAGGSAFALILLLHQPAGQNLFLEYPWRIWLLLLLSICAFLVVCGIAPRPAAALATLTWAFAAYSELHSGQPWFSLPVRDCEFFFLYATLALAGPGRFSFAYWFRSLAAKGHPWGN